VNDGLLAGAQPEAVPECVAVACPVSYGPTRDGVRGVVTVSDHNVFGVKAGVAAGVASWGLEIDLVDVDGAGRVRLYRCQDRSSNYQKGDQKGANGPLEPPSLTVASDPDGEMSTTQSA